MQAIIGMNRRPLWLLLTTGATLIGGIGYGLVLSGVMLRSVPEPLYSMVVLTCIPGVLVGSLTIGSVHSGFGDSVVAVVLTAIISGVFWGSMLFAASMIVRRLRHHSAPAA